MNCPFCGHKNFAGADACESCGHDLTAIEAARTKQKLREGPLGTRLGALGTLAPGIVAPGDSVSDALPLMRKDPRGSVLVMVEGELKGIFTERDLIRRTDHGADLDAISIESVMTPEPFTYNDRDSVAYALNGMTVWGNRHLPIMDEDQKLQGFISVRKVLRYIKEASEGQA